MNGSSQLAQGSAIVIDIGKTLSKVSLWSRQGACLGRETRLNERHDAAPYAPLDVAATSDWLITALASFADHPVEAIIPVTHGAAVAGIRDGALTFLPPDYEWEIPASILAEYRKHRDSFAETGSPALPCGLNIGSQLHYLETLDPALLDGVTLMPYAQYWAWLLSGVATSEVTSLGCHSDLWSPQAGTFSAMAQQRGWADRIAPLTPAGAVIGTLLPELAARTGLSPQVRVHAGLHDSNAALLAARGFAQIADHDATVLSTGTWFVAMRSMGQSSMPASLPEDRDCLINVDVDGRPVPSARFMGGREIEMLGARIDRAGTDGLADVLYSGAMVTPAQVPDCGPFPGLFSRKINWPDDPDEQAAAVALYTALMADSALDLIGAQDRLLIEGRFAGSEMFVRALATLRPDTQVFAVGGEADVSFGALRLILPELSPPEVLGRVRPLDRDLCAYRDAWFDAIEAFA